MIQFKKSDRQSRRESDEDISILLAGSEEETGTVTITMSRAKVDNGLYGLVSVCLSS